ncbi:MAG: methyltransferase domain-containing protein [Deltaproteobacteria bacterium]|nr:methyltransferase domain-containing protein [Deltaproteobacteria bacterium]
MTRKIHPSHYILYDWFAPLYDLGVWLLAAPFGGEDRIREAVLSEIESGGLAGKKALEVFAGTATLSIAAAEKGADAVAVDLSAGMLKVAGEKAKRAGVKLRILRADAAELPFPAGTFDRVIASMGLHETPDELIPAVLKEAHRVLRGGGRLTIFDFHRAEGAAKYFQGLFFVFFEGETARSWVSADIQALLRDTGFKNFKRKFFLRRSLQLLTADKT